MHLSIEQSNIKLANYNISYKITDPIKRLHKTTTFSNRISETKMAMRFLHKDSLKERKERKKRSERCQRTSCNVSSALFADVRSTRVGRVNLPKGGSGTRFNITYTYFVAASTGFAPIFFSSTRTNSSIPLFHKNSSILHSYGLNSTFPPDDLRKFYICIYTYIWDS